MNRPGCWSGGGSGGGGKVVPRPLRTLQMVQGTVDDVPHGLLIQARVGAHGVAAQQRDRCQQQAEDAAVLHRLYTPVLAS